MVKKKVIYARGFPFGAPLVVLRGAGTKDIKDFLKRNNFLYDPQRHGWISYLYEPELKLILLEIRRLGLDVVPKEGMDKSYIVNLENENKNKDQHGGTTWQLRKF